MPNIRHFRVDLPMSAEIENPYLADLAEIKARDARFEAFLKEWGDENFIQGPDGRVLGLKDPRTFDPPQPLPKGWKKMTRFAGFVKPSASIGHAQIAALHFPNFDNLRTWLMLTLFNMNPENAARLGSSMAKSWFGAVQGTNYAFKVSAMDLEEDGLWLAVPDPLLVFDRLPGCTEVLEGERLRVIEAFNKKRAETQAQKDGG